MQVSSESVENATVNYAKLIQHAKEYPELDRLRLKALRVQNEKQTLRSKKPASKTWSLLKIVLWKNLTIRKRRKSQFFLLLFQIFLWFSIASFSIAPWNRRSEYPDEPYDGLTQLVPRVQLADLQIPIPIAFNPALDVHNTTSLISGNQSKKSWTPFRRDLTDLLARVTRYYKLTYEGHAPPYHLFKDYNSLLKHMRLDKRFPYGIYIDDLCLDEERMVTKLVFWEREVPTTYEFNPFNCRISSSYLGPFDSPCDMKLYGKHGFVFVQEALVTAFTDILAERRHLSSVTLIQKPGVTATRHNEHSAMLNLDALPLEATEAPNRFRLELPGLGIVAERYPEHHAVRSYAAEAATSAPFYFMFALVSVFSFVVMDMVSEKESKMKEVMKTYGLSSTMFWVSWLLTYAVLNLVIVWCAVFICSIGGIFGPVTSIVVVALLLYTYLLSLMTLGFAISVFFHRAQTATVAAMVFNLFLYALSWVLHKTRSASLIIRGFMMLLSTVTFSLSLIDLISLLPDRGVTLTTLFNFKEHSVGIYLLFLIFDTALYFFLAWYLDQVIQSDWGSTKHWTFVFDRIARSFKTHLTKFSCKYSAKEANNEETAKLLDNDAESDGTDFPHDNDRLEEPVAQEVQQRGVSVKIRNLVKRFTGEKGVKTAVDGISLDIYPGEIFGLLGYDVSCGNVSMCFCRHNGAGKTTTISMLTGMLQIDDGDAFILGHSIKNDQEGARKLISVCPQQNMFFEDLTCLEHLVFFAALRGIDVSEGLEQADNPTFFSDVVVQKRFLLEQRGHIVDALVNAKGATGVIHRSGLIEMEKHFQRFGLSLFTDPNIQYIHGQGRTVVAADSWAGVLAAVEKVGLSEKLHSFPRMLSGGMKRRLWLTIALIGDPKVVFLDEPTSGVDPLGRQELWRQIQDEKIAGRCIIITTHHMEEADILADRKAVMTAGRLRCVGSSLFLKSRFGIGYYLECSVSPHVQSLDDSAARILAVIQRHVPEAQRHQNDTKGTATAMAAARHRLLLFSLPLSSIQHFPALFKDIEAEKENLFIENYGASLSTLEEVFFKLGDEEMQAKEGLPLTPLEAVGTQRRDSVLLNTPVVAPTGKRLSYDASIDHRFSLPSPPPLKRGVRGDLVSQKFSRNDATTPSFLKCLYAIVVLRFLQIVQNKVTFLVDVVFPVLMLIASLFFREGGAGLLTSLARAESTTISLFDHWSIFNTTIAYSIDARLTGSGLLNAYALLKHLPPDMKDLLQRVEVLEIGSEAAETSVSSNSHDAPMSSGLMDIGLKDLGGAPALLPLDPSQLNTPVYGRAVRNYLFAVRKPQATKKRIAAGLSFEPWSTSALTDNTAANSSYDSNRLQVRIFYDAGLPHALPMMLVVLNSAFLASHIPESSTMSAPLQPYHRVRIESTPLLVESPVYITAITYPMYIMLTLGLSSLPSRFGTQIMFDKFVGTKHAMIVMGLPFSVYWLGTFACNYLAMVFGNYIVCGFIAYFIPYFWSFAIVPVLLCAVFFSASVLLWSYFLSQLFRNMKAYSMTLHLTGMFFALIPAYVVSVFSDAATSGAKWGNAMLVAHIISSFTFPAYNPIGVLIGCCVVVSDGFSLQRQPQLIDYFRLTNLPIWSVIGSATQAVILFFATVVIDRRHYNGKSPYPETQVMLNAFYQRWQKRRAEWLQHRQGNENLIPASLRDLRDQDVLAEEFECAKIRKILDGQQFKYSQAKTAREKEELSQLFQMAAAEDSSFPDELPLVLIDDLHYLFTPMTESQPPHVAVRGFSLSIYRGEIFGLLGPNGAGKTTSINLLTCNYMIEAPTRGVALMGGHDVSKNPTAAFSHLGLCPQFDALWGDVKVRDNLRVFARIKNVPESKLESVLDAYVKDLDLQEHQYKRLSECSGGNKRRVSVAVAFLGDPDVVLMDEPSSGIDPVGRRRLADLIHRNSESRCVLITTHSMEEAEALCTRVGIIVNGQLNCLNTSLAIRQQYGSGIRLEVIFDDTSPNYIGFDPTGKTLNPWQEFLRDSVHIHCTEVHRVANRVTYDIPLKSNSLGSLFLLFETNKAQFGIKDYALSQPTLEQVFIAFAKSQKSAQETMQEIFRVG